MYLPVFSPPQSQLDIVVDYRLAGLKLNIGRDGDPKPSLIKLSFHVFELRKAVSCSDVSNVVFKIYRLQMIDKCSQMVSLILPFNNLEH